MRRLTALAVLLLSVAMLLAAPWGSARAAEPFFFVQLTDPQFGMYTSNADFAQETANLEFAVAAVNRLKPALVVVTGDLVNKAGDAAQIAEYRRIVGKIDSTIPVYNVAGNHDVENVPTPATLAAYTEVYGPDHYTFEKDGLVGIVIDSVIIHSPASTPDQLAEQKDWLKTALARAKDEGARHIVVFMHHPLFLREATEPDQSMTIPGERRAEYLALFHENGVRYVFAGHLHRDVVARDGDLEMVATAPVGKPSGSNDRSGLRVVIVRDSGIEHRYYDFGQLPNRIDLQPRGARGARGG